MIGEVERLVLERLEHLEKSLTEALGHESRLKHALQGNQDSIAKLRAQIGELREFASPRGVIVEEAPRRAKECVPEDGLMSCARAIGRRVVDLKWSPDGLPGEIVEEVAAMLRSSGAVAWPPRR